ncbi:MAG: bifunctional precorrin-2 dehydrogenase/sirohydrochlorin ferrochelatase [Magnetococcales bacterium]|nr:bifunctional precorrin-2 dehydrogenase/sirohydrochlorin ferrochelatase [Magnetococcales bacterium]MBF0439057.1 bifunctional precorrin-2 dehydrogenase/sirohydrochlorin ferrochelatase [Magnetococcales bacterium]
MDKACIPHYMAELVLAGRGVMVVGGGRVARRKIEGLLICGAVVTVVAPELDGQVADWVKDGRVVHWPILFATEVLEQETRPFLVFAATASASLNREIASECARRAILCNSADDPSSSGFLVPAMVRRGDVTVAVGTGGRSPALSRVLKERIDAWLEPGWGEVVAAFGDWRQRVTVRIPNGVQRQDFWRECAQEAVKQVGLAREDWDGWFRQQLRRLGG